VDGFLWKNRHVGAPEIDWPRLSFSAKGSWGGQSSKKVRESDQRDLLSQRRGNARSSRLGVSARGAFDELSVEGVGGFRRFVALARV
jgi:hypothetical protein